MKHTIKNDLKKADTGCYLLLNILFGDAQRHAMCYGLAIKSGLGVTYSAISYAEENENVYYLGGNEIGSEKGLYSQLLQAMGSDQLIRTSRDKMIAAIENIIDNCGEDKEPLIIIDNASLLSLDALYAATKLYKRLINKCGLVIMGTDNLRERIIDEVRQSDEKYSEIYNTIGRRFVTLGTRGPKDVELICRANGVKDEKVIERIKNDTSHLGGVKAMIEDYKEQQALDKAAERVPVTTGKKFPEEDYEETLILEAYRELMSNNLHMSDTGLKLKEYLVATKILPR